MSIVAPPFLPPPSNKEEVAALYMPVPCLDSERREVSCETLRMETPRLMGKRDMDSGIKARGGGGGEGLSMNGTGTTV